MGDKSFSGFPTPSRRQEIYSKTMTEFGYPEHAPRLVGSKVMSILIS